MNRIRLAQSVVIATFLRFGRKLRTFSYVSICKSTTDRVACLGISNRLKQSPTHNFESFFGCNWFPKRLYASKGFLQGTKGALRALEKTFGRVQALWKPVAAEETFEIVRRRLFEPVRDPKTRDAICRAFADAYVAEGAKLPAETQEGRYYDRLRQAYPIHPEIFDRLYEDWTTIGGFQWTRGVLKLMAKVIYRLWKDDNKDLLIMPGSLPLHDGSTRNELTYYLPAGWDAVVARD